MTKQFDAIALKNAGRNDGGCLLCCSSDEIGCASARAEICKTGSSVVWHSFRSIPREWNLGLTFEFAVKEYDTFIQELRDAY